MAVTPVGNPYVESSDRVSDYPGASEALAERIDIVGVNPFANAAARDAAIPSPVQGQMCSLNDDNKGYRYDGSAWVLFSGAGAANFTNAATGTYSSGGDSFKYITFTGSGSLEISQAGLADILVIGGGASGGVNSGGGGGAGGHLSITGAYLPLGTLTVVVGAGAAGGSPAIAYNSNPGQSGVASSIGSPLYISPGGGAGSAIRFTYSSAERFADEGVNGGSGGGASSGNGGGTTSGGLGITNIGNNGGNGVTGGDAEGGGGGGGAGGVGSNGSNLTGGAGGAGISNSLNNTATTRAGGGGGGGGSGGGGAGGSGGGGAGGNAGGTSGSANTGSGGGGCLSGTSGSGGSGLIIVRVVV